MKLSCLILAFNEAHRIRTALTHAAKWADEVVVVDKGSTDGTQAIAESLGARVAPIPFSKQGHEDLAEYASKASNDWVWGFTPGEVPTKAMIEKGKELIGQDYDLIRIPHKYYSFGVHHENSPWSISLQPRLYNRTKVKFTGWAHDPIQPSSKERAFNQWPTQEIHVLHQTHTDAQSFMRTHADYMINEANNGTPQEVIDRAVYHLKLFEDKFNSTPVLKQQQIAWDLYWRGVLLHALDRIRPNIKAEYHSRAQEALQEWL